MSSPAFQLVIADLAEPIWTLHITTAPQQIQLRLHERLPLIRQTDTLHNRKPAVLAIMGSCTVQQS